MACWDDEKAVEQLAKNLDRPAGAKALDLSDPVAICRQLSRPEESISLHQLAELPVEQVDMFSLVLVGNSSTKVAAGMMATPRGYPGAELS